MASFPNWLNPYLESIKSFTSYYTSKFKQYPLWKQAFISSTIMIGSPIIYTFASYYYCKLRYPSIPNIHYTITGDLDNNDGILLFIHGFPDFGYLWDPQIKFFNNKNYCCINIEIPNFYKDRIQNPWGYSIKQLTLGIANTIKQILNNRECIFIVHDWGCFLTNMLYLNHREKINMKKLILIDIADGPGRDKNGKSEDPRVDEKSSYILVQALLFMTPKWFGTWYLRRYWENMIKTDSSMKGLPFPLFDKEKKENKKYFHSLSAHLYFNLMKQIIFGDVRSLAVTPRLNEFDGLPILFADGCGGDDPMPGYSKKFKKFIEDRDYCKFVVFGDCGHWIMQQNPTRFNQVVYEFIQK